MEFEELLETWEGNYKKGLLTFWLLMILHQRKAYAFEMTGLVSELSGGMFSVDEKSIYRSLKRFTNLGITSSSWEESEIGPQRRYYQLTELGVKLLQVFIRRNILVFQTEEVAGRIRGALNGAAAA
jgi:PadR family transcriptional regulator PadR